MKERPIIFSGEMVRAILAGEKTQTRRVVKPQPTKVYPGDGCYPVVNAMCFDEKRIRFITSPYHVGMRLWVRETIDGRFGCDSFYVADESRLVDALGWDIGAKHVPCKIISSIHMPRWASRITLEITNVRVERVQEISEEDAKAEGVDSVKSFKDLWNSIYFERGFGWNKNPWVWVLEFKRV